MNQPLKHDPDALPKPILPSWIFDHQTPDCLEEAAFSSGSALALLHAVLNDLTINVPPDLLRSRLALHAATQCCKIEGRAVTEADLRDAVLLTQPGDAMGPDGDMLAQWRGGIAVNLRGTGWQTRLVGLLHDDLQDIVAEALDLSGSGAGGPVAKATSALTRILTAFPRQEALALLCADAILSHALGWIHPLDLSRFRSAPGAHLSGLPFECQGAFPA